METYNDYEEYFKTYQRRQMMFKNVSDEWVEKVIEMYNYSKSIITKDNYSLVNKKIDLCTSKTPFKYILDTKSNFILDGSSSYMYKSLDSFSSKKEVLDFIINSARNILYENYKSRLIIPNETSFDSFDTTGYCYEACLSVMKVCNELRIKNQIIEISPGFDDSLKLMGDYGHHYVVLVKIDNEVFLMDCAYKQFFDVTHCPLEKMGIYKGSLPWLGIYMVMEERRKKLSEKLLSDGWIKLDDKNMKDYFDGFALGYRNALYYECLGYLDFSTNYTANDYENFIFGDDSQANHEQIEHLGTQKTFIKNPKIDYKTDVSLLKG